ncbi:MAG: single-stranded DNA-binding protein [Leptotrichia sp.]|nr:single-stranded DNA-binding protein [Leptotrichia sp.]
MNNVVLIGRLTKDPELKYSQAGKAYCRFTVAVNRDFNKEEADFINCLAFGKTAETIAEWLGKGRRIALQGRIQTGSYQNSNGDTVYTTEVVADRFEFIDSARSETSKNQSYSNNNDDVLDDNDDFPF